MWGPGVYRKSLCRRYHEGCDRFSIVTYIQQLEHSATDKRGHIVWKYLAEEIYLSIEGLVRPRTDPRSLDNLA